MPARMIFPRPAYHGCLAKDAAGLLDGKRVRYGSARRSHSRRRPQPYSPRSPGDGRRCHVVRDGSGRADLQRRRSPGQRAALPRSRGYDRGRAAAGRLWRFDADDALFCLVSEAHRIRLAYLFDPLLAAHSSLVEPLPHQITAVYGEMLTRQPLRYLLADDPGAGKMSMAGLLIEVPPTDFPAGDAYHIGIAETRESYAAGEGCVVRYVHQPFAREPDFGAVSVNYEWGELWDRGEEPV
jgi:hypothetical protein